MTTIIKNCDGRHKICMDNTNYLKNNITNSKIFNKDIFFKYLETITSNYNYSSCLTSYSNKNCDEIINFIVVASKLVELPIAKIIQLTTFIPDDKLELILKGQITIDALFINKLVTNKNTKNSYNSNIGIIPNCIAYRKLNTFKYIISHLDISNFNDIINSKETLSPEYEKCMIEYIKANKEKFNNVKLINDVMKTIINKPKIIKELYTIMSSKIEKSIKKELLDNCINTLDCELILAILEGNDVIPDIITIEKMMSKVIFRPLGAYNAKQIAEILDIFIMYGFKITKEIIIKLLTHGCHINSIEKYSCPIDTEILEICCNISYYPYDFSCIPPHSIMIKECEKNTNLDRIKVLKEKGGLIDATCLEKACGVKKNSKVIKYIISDCGVKANETCLMKFQEAYGIESLDILMKNYSNQKPIDKKINGGIEIDSDSTMIIEKREIKIFNKMEYILKNKIKTLLNYKKKNIIYDDLVELMFKYLINNKLVIGNYFIINKELSNLLKLNQCTIINIDQLENIISYFIDLE